MVDVDLTVQRIRALGSHLIDPELTAQIFEELPDALVLITRPDAVIQLVNRQAELLFGYHRSEMFDRHLDMLLPTEKRVIHRQHLEEYFRAPRARPMGIGMYLTGMRKDNVQFEVEISLGPIITPHSTFVVAVIRPTKYVKHAATDA